MLTIEMLCSVEFEIDNDKKWVVMPMIELLEIFGNNKLREMKKLLDCLI